MQQVSEHDKNECVWLKLASSRIFDVEETAIMARSAIIEVSSTPTEWILQGKILPQQEDFSMRKINISTGLTTLPESKGWLRSNHF